MDLAQLAAWQWQDYARYHQTRLNLLVHIVAVPLFLLGNVLLLAALFMWAWWMAVAGLLLSLLAFAAQGIGHKREPVPSVPFTGPANVAGRVAVEQWFTFPRFVASGGWAENYRRARPPGAPA